MRFLTEESFFYSAYISYKNDENGGFVGKIWVFWTDFQMFLIEKVRKLLNFSVKNGDYDDFDGDFLAS